MLYPSLCSADEHWPAAVVGYTEHHHLRPDHPGGVQGPPNEEVSHSYFNF